MSESEIDVVEWAVYDIHDDKRGIFTDIQYRYIMVLGVYIERPSYWWVYRDRPASFLFLLYTDLKS